MFPGMCNKIIRLSISFNLFRLLKPTMGLKVDDHASLYVLFPASFSMYICLYFY